jgi:hypothetical protein
MAPRPDLRRLAARGGVLHPLPDPWVTSATYYAPSPRRRAARSGYSRVVATGRRTSRSTSAAP